MKAKYVPTAAKLLGFFGLYALTMTPWALAATCTTYTYVVGTSTGPVGCTLEGGAVSFSNFSVTGLANGALLNMSFLDAGALQANAFGGVSFQPNTPGGTPYTVSYTADIAGGNFTKVGDSATPGGIASYSFSGTGFSCAGPSIFCNTSIPLTTTLVNSATYDGTVASNQTITLNFYVDPLLPTPEPASFALIGGALVALGLVARGRKRKN